MKQKDLFYLKKLIKIVYPEDTDTQFIEITNKIFNEYMYTYGLGSYEKKPNHWKAFWGEDKEKDLPSDLFSIIKYRPHIFAKVFNLVVPKQDIIKTITSLLSREDKNITQIFSSHLKQLQEKVYWIGKQKLHKKQEQLKETNNLNRGNYYLDGKKYNEPNLINPKKICLVHATNFFPKQNQEGKYFIETTAHALDYLTPKSTVHFTCNHIVESHLNGNWDEMQYVILAPLQDVIKLNGAPRRFSSVDTYFLPDPDTGVVLPDSVMIVEPSDKLPDNKLFIITPNNHCYYRRRNFSKTQIETLTKSPFFNPNTTEKNENYWAVLSRKIATEAIMEQNGFNYLKNHTITDLNTTTDFYYTGKNMGFEAIDNQYAHVSDESTFIFNKTNTALGVLAEAEHGKKISEWQIAPVKTWLQKHVLEDTPVDHLKTEKSDTPEAKKLKEKYNRAIDLFLQKLHKQISTESDIETYLKQLSDSRD